MSTSGLPIDEDTIQQALSAKPFRVTKVKAVRSGVASKNLARHFNLKPADARLLRECISNTSLRLSFTCQEGEEKARALGTTAITPDISLIVEKKEDVPGIATDDYLLDSPFLKAVADTVLALMQEKQARALQVTGWITEVDDDSVAIAVYDEDDTFTTARVPREHFSRCSDLSEGSEFMIQIWEYFGQQRCDFLPVDTGVVNLRHRVMSSLRKWLSSRTDRKRGLSSKANMKRYLADLNRKYGGIPWGRTNA